MISEKLNRIHNYKEAIPNQIYRDIDRQVYKGTSSGRLILIPNYDELNSVENENKRLESRLDILDTNFNKLNKKLTYSQFELDEQDNLMPKTNYVESEYLFFNGDGSNPIASLESKDNSLLDLEEKYFELDSDNNMMPK